MKRNKFLALMMAFVMLVTALTGCGGNNDADTDKNNDASNQQNNTPAQTENTPNPDTSSGLPAMTTDEITPTVALWGQAEKGEVEAREHQIAAFEKAYPNIHVEFVSIDQADWNATLTARAADGTLPDVFGVFQVVDAIANNWALDVTEFYENDPDAQEVYPYMINNVRFGGKLFCMPWVLFPAMYFVNETMFEKYNEPMPSYDWTVDDFKEIAERITHPEDFYFGTSQPLMDEFFMPYYDGTSALGWDGKNYNFSQTWIDARDLRNEWIQNGTVEWMAEEDKLSQLGDPQAWPPGWGRSAMHLDWSWSISAFEDIYTPQSGCTFRYYPQPMGPTGCEMDTVDFGVISATTQYPREAWELQKWMMWGKEACLNRFDGYKEAGVAVISRMPVISNEEVWAAAGSYADEVNPNRDNSDIKALYEHLRSVNILPAPWSSTPGYPEFEQWLNENDIWGQLNRYEVTPAEMADELTQTANKFKDDWFARVGLS